MPWRALGFRVLGLGFEGLGPGMARVSSKLARLTDLFESARRTPVADINGLSVRPAWCFAVSQWD